MKRKYLSVAFKKGRRFENQNETALLEQFQWAERKGKNEKRISLLLVLVITVGCFVACGGGSGSGSSILFNEETASKLGDLGGLKLPLVEKPVAIEMAVTTSHEDFNTSWVAEKLREVTGVDVQSRVVPPSMASEKMSV